MQVIAVMSCLSIVRGVPAKYIFLRQHVAAANLKFLHFLAHAPLLLESKISSPFAQNDLRPA